MQFRRQAGQYFVYHTVGAVCSRSINYHMVPQELTLQFLAAASGEPRKRKRFRSFDGELHRLAS